MSWPEMSCCMAKMTCTIMSIKPVPSCFVLSLRRRIPDYYAEGALWQELSAFAREAHISVSDKTFSIYHDTEYKETDVDSGDFPWEDEFNF